MKQKKRQLASSASAPPQNIIEDSSYSAFQKTSTNGRKSLKGRDSGVISSGGRTSKHKHSFNQGSVGAGSGKNPQKTKKLINKSRSKTTQAVDILQSDRSFGGGGRVQLPEQKSA